MTVTSARLLLSHDIRSPRFNKISLRQVVPTAGYLAKEKSNMTTNISP